MDGNILTPISGQVDLTSIEEEESEGTSSRTARLGNCETPVQSPGSHPVFPGSGPETNSPNFNSDPFISPSRGYPENFVMARDAPPTYFDNMGIPNVPEYPPMMFTGQLCTTPPPHFFYPPLLYPGYPVNLESAVHNPQFVAQFLYRDGIRPPHHNFPPVETVVEYRQDLILGASFLPIWALDPSRHFGRNIFVPMQPFVYTVIESVTHYCDQPYATMVKGEWVPGMAHVPLAHHICICLDDGFKRYEEVIRVSILNPDSPKEIGMSEACYISVSHRLRKPAPHRRPTFRAALQKSLQGIIPDFSTVPMELSVSRASTRNSEIEKAIMIVVRDSQEPFETFFYPLIQSVFQTFCIRLTGTHYIVTGHLFRPLMFSATLMLSSGEKQILDTVNLHFNYKDRRIYATSTDTSIAEISYDERGHVNMAMMETCAYSDMGGQVWGPQLLMTNPKIPASCHPFANLSLNPVLNRSFNPYHTYAFNTPPIFCSRTSCFPPPYRPGGHMEGNPLPYFYPMVTPAGMPLPGFGPIDPLHDPLLIPGDGPGISYGMGSCSLVSDVVGCHEVHSEPHSPRSFLDPEILACMNSPVPGNDGVASEHNSRPDSPTEEQDPDSKSFNLSTSSLKLNPDANDFVPRGLSSPFLPPEPPAFNEPPVTHVPQMLLAPPPPYPVAIPILKIGPQMISLIDPCMDSGSDYFTDEDVDDVGELEMISLHHPAPQLGHNASSSDTSVLVAHCTDPHVFLKNMDSQSSALDSGTASDSRLRKKKGQSSREGRSDQERSSGLEDQEADGVPEVSIHKSWSEEVEAHAHNNPIPILDPEQIYRTAPPAPPPYEFSQQNYDSKPRRGGPKTNYRGRGGANRGEPAWSHRKHPAQGPNWRDNRFENLQNPGNFDGPPPFPPKPSYYQRRNANQSYEDRNNRFKPDGSFQPGGNDGVFYSGRGRGGWRGTRGYRPHYSHSSEYHSYGEGEQGGRGRGNHSQAHNNHNSYYNPEQPNEQFYMDERNRNEGYISTDPDHDHNASYASVTRPKSGGPECSEHKTDPNSEESHGEGGPLILTETTFTNSQNSSYRNFNNAANSGRGRGYRGTYTRSYDNRPQNQNYSREPSRDREERNSQDPGYYGGQRPIGQNWISRKYRKFNDNDSHREESNMLDAFADEEVNSKASQRRSGIKSSRYNFSSPHRNLIEIQTSPASGNEEFPPLGSECSRQSSPAPSSPKVEVSVTFTPAGQSQKKKQKKYKKTKTRKDGEVVGSSDDDTLRSSGSTPRAKKLIPTPPNEVIPGDGVYNEPNISGSSNKSLDKTYDESVETDQDLSERSESSNSRSPKTTINWDSAGCGEPSD